MARAPEILTALACRIPFNSPARLAACNSLSPNSFSGIFPQVEWGRSLLYQATHSMVAVVTSVTLSHGPSPVTPGPDRHFQGIEGQLGPQRIRDLPADHHPGKQIENKRGLRKATRRPGVVMSATRRRFGAPAVKSRSSRSDGRSPALPGWAPSCAASSSAGRRQRRTTSVLLMKNASGRTAPDVSGESRFVNVASSGIRSVLTCHQVVCSGVACTPGPALSTPRSP